MKGTGPGLPVAGSGRSILERRSLSYQKLVEICGAHVSRHLLIFIIERMERSGLLPGFRLTRDCRRAKEILLAKLDEYPGILDVLSDSKVITCIQEWFREWKEHEFSPRAHTDRVPHGPVESVVRSSLVVYRT